MARPLNAVIMLLAAAGVESLGLWLFFHDLLAGPVLGAGHTAVCISLLVQALITPSPGPLMLSAFATFAGGPVAAFAGAILCGSMAHHDSSRVDEAWLDQISGPGKADSGEELFLQISSGQARQTDNDIPEPFEKIMVTGSVHEKRALLGVVIHSYHPLFDRLLDMARRSPVAEIRVHAAAAFTALRRREKVRLAEVGGRTGRSHACIADTRKLATLATSRFLSDGERHEAERELCDLIAEHLAGIERGDIATAAKIKILVESKLYSKALDLLASPSSLENGEMGAANTHAA